MAASRFTKVFQELAAAWPKDPLRPSVSFAQALDGRASTGRTTERETDLLRRLLNNKYQGQFPLSPRFTSPTSNPSYYTDLLAELEQAPSRSWLARKMQSWKGVLRFS